MLRLTLKQLASKKLRLLSTATAVIIGVAFLSGTLALTDTVLGTFDSLLADAEAETDVYVRGASPLDLGFGEGRPRLDSATVDQLRAVEGVDELAVRVTGYAQILDQEGKAVGNPQSGVLAMNWTTVERLNPFKLSSGRAPTSAAEIVIDKSSADAAGFVPGDRTTVLTPGAPRPATIVGIARFGSADSPGGTAVVLFDDATAQAVLAEPGQVDGAAFIAADGVSAQTLIDSLTPYAGDANEVITGAQLIKESQDKIHEDIASFGLFMTVFAGIAMFVAAFIINNTFSIIVSQRTKEMALLRAIGASGRQVRAAVLAEAAVVGVTASAIGFVAGLGVARVLQLLLSAVGLEVPTSSTVVQTSTVVISVTTGVLVTVVSAVLPARRASRVPPIAALRDVAQDRSARSKRRTFSGLVTAGLGVAVLLGGLNAANVKVVGAGAVGVFIGVAVLAPVLARPVAFVIGHPAAKLRGMAGVLARENAMRNPRRTARTAASLMIGVALVVFITIFASSAKSSGAGALRRDYRGTHILDSGAFDATAGLSPELADEVRSAHGVRLVSEERITHVLLDGIDTEFFRAFDAVAIGQLFDLGTVEGDLSQLGTDGIAVEAGEGPDSSQLGDTREVTFSSGPKTFVVRAIYDNSAEWVGHQFVDVAAFAATVPTQLDSKLYVDTVDEAALVQLAAPYPTADVMDKPEFITAQNAKIDVVLKLIYALLGLAILIALLGIVNTLALSIHERHRELGLLRAVGMSRAQVRSAVRWESVIIALFGTSLGLCIGIFFGWAMTQALADQGIDQLTIPVPQLAVVTGIAALAGVGAAVIPARRAAQIDVLKAVASA
jgi:putative ABC transport system permease protein